MTRDYLLSLLPTKTDFRKGFHDLWSSLFDWNLWGILGWHDIRQRYRRSLLGPLWVTMSMAIYVGAIGILWSKLFGISSDDFIPHLCLGILVWTLFTSTINECCTTFETNTHLILQSRKPLFIYILWVIWRNLIIFMHNFVVYIPVMLMFSVDVNANTFWLLLSAPLMLLCITWVSFLLGILSVRYRDVPPIIASILTVLFFLTPVMWKSEQLGRYEQYVYWNPVTHIIELIRAPLLGQALPVQTWIVGGSMASIGWVIAIIFFVRFRNRIPYWL